MLSESAATAVIRLEAPEQAARKIAERFAEELGGDGVAVAVFESGPGRWRVAVHCRDMPDEAAVRGLAETAAGPELARSLRIERLAATDWVRESLAGLKPVAAGRFVVHGSHDRAVVAPNRIGIEIEAALAFGTGHHGTTRGCLLALDRLCKAQPARRRAPRILDLGTGTGVLAIAAARALQQRVFATDIDAAAVRLARANAQLNRAGALVAIVQADGVTGRRVRAGAPYDLVFANILLRPLQRFAAPLRRIAAPGARIVLSGLLATQANAALVAYRGFVLERRITLDGWTTLVLVRPVRFKRERRFVARATVTP